MKTAVLLAAVLLAAPVLSHAAADHAGHQMANMDHGSKTDVGQPGKTASRSINIDMADNMRFAPERITVKPGETIRFVIKNSGVVRHEFVLGSTADLQAHYQMMLQQPAMEHHGAGNALTLDPGQSGELIWRFPKQGEVAFGCLEPGHYPAGMKGLVTVQ